MKRFSKIFLFLLFLAGFSTIYGQKYYDDQWKKVEENKNKGGDKSNLPIISDIQNQAMKDNNFVQIIRSLKEEFSILNRTSDDDENNAVSVFFNKISNTEKLLKGQNRTGFKVLESTFFLDYYKQNYWKINGTTSINSQDISQIETWSKLDFKNYLTKNFKELDLLKSDMKVIKLSEFKGVFSSSENLSYFPTLADWYDLKKVDFLSNNQLFTKNEIAENRNEIDKIYDELIRFNSGNSKLYFMHQKLNENCKISRCKDKVEQLKKLVDSDIKGDYKVLIIEDIMSELVARKEFKSALEFAATAKVQYSGSSFIKNIENKEEQIKLPVLTFRYEQQTQPNRPIHFVVDHKNISDFTLNIYEVKSDYKFFLQYIENSYSDSFKKINKKLVRKEVFSLPDLKDYQNHSTSLDIQPLPSGAYIAEYNIPGGDNDNRQNFYFLVSGNKIVYQNKGYNDKDSMLLKLVNSENGKAVGKEDVVFYEFVKNDQLNKSSVKTDEKGTVKLPSNNDNYYRMYLVHQPKSNDFQIFNIYGGSRYSDENPHEKTQYNAKIFTDRAIYRPGQTVYFKVINTKASKKTAAVVSGLKQTIMLKDANYQDVAVQEFTTNEFGSYHGSFVLPKGKLNGNYSLRTEGEAEAYRVISVEEYKRPKFEVMFEPVKEEYKYGQTVGLKGKAMMFSGVALSNTTVSYEIKKRNIRWKYFKWYPIGNDNENSVLGQVVTNDKGEFVVLLDLKKDENVEGIQIDNYEINASVKDINGETQSASTQLEVASVSHYIAADIIGNKFSDEEIRLKVETKNYSQQDLKKSYQVKLSKLQIPQKIFRDNFKNAVQDQPKYSKEEFFGKFPHDLFDKNEQKENWEIANIITERKQSSETDLNLGKLNAGSYKLELYNIEGKDTIKTSQFFDIWDKNALKPEQKTFLTVLDRATELSAGEQAKIYVYSAIPNALVTVFIQDGTGKTLTETHQLRNGVLVYRYNIPNEKSVSVVNLQFQIVAFNDVQTETLNLKIKNIDKPLKIETTTFRDKLEPNVKERWTVKVSGNDHEKINAEVLASMYDMSLDKFAANKFTWEDPSISQFMFTSLMASSYNMNQDLASAYYRKKMKYYSGNHVEVPRFNWFGSSVSNALQGRVRSVASMSPSPMPTAGHSVEEVTLLAKSEVYDDGIADLDDESNLEEIPVRQNLNETAFFYPDLKTDSEGNVSFEFTSPEALTKWKLMFLAHTKDARAATLEKEVVTQKEFSVTPNYPRFLREGDELNLQTKLSNLTDKKLSGSAQLQILDAFTNEDISGKFALLKSETAGNKNQSFSLDENGNSSLTWRIKVPENVSSVVLKVVAKAGQYSDGEQKVIAILPNRMLVTDAVPIFVKEGETKTFELQNLKNGDSKTISNVSNTLELTTNPIWEVIFALPSLKNDPNNSADVVFNKWFADVLASEIFKSNPKIKTVFEEYQNKGLLTSNLEKNQGLKQLLLEETPWVLESKNEKDQMEKISLLFDINNMRNTIQGDWDDLEKLQNPDGGFSWYQGYPSSYSTSLYILKNFGKINSWLKDSRKEYQASEQNNLVKNLIKYVDNEIDKYFDVKKENVWNNWVLDYLDTRNYWEKEYPLKGKGAMLQSLVKQRAAKAKLKEFTFFGLHRSALLMHNYGLKDLSNKLLNYLKETSVDSKTQGVYWKKNLDGWGWFSSKVVNQAGALEAFNELKPDDKKFIEDLKIWLITQKEVNSWGSSRATSEVIFTILNSGKSWIGAESDKATIIWGGKELQPQSQATGYIKSVVKSDVVDKNLGTVTVTKPGAGIVQGGLFWQYYEDLDKIKSSESYISITKELYKKIKTVNGEELQKITSGTPLKVGDKVTVRMILNTDRSMEYIHIKDMRASGFEPVDVFSGYQWKNNLGYYQSTKDASTNFYIQYMPKGRYVFEYDYITNASGMFSNGITTMQNYYAPQMNAHTSGTGIHILE